MCRRGLLLSFRDKPGNGDAVAVQDKGYALVPGAVHAIREVSRCLSHADGAGLHKIRLYDFMYLRSGGINLVNSSELR
jgi:hypothetical protein